MPKPVKIPNREASVPNLEKEVQEEQTIYGVPEYPNPINYYIPEKPENNIEEYNEAYRKKLEVKSKAQSREIAKKLFCAWHPWRRAHAICAHCHRPFCYEDLAEYKDGYYCLEDINTVMQSYIQKLHVTYNATSLISTILMLAAFLVFVYYARGQLTYVLTYAYEQGLIGLIQTVRWAYILVFMELAVMVASMVSALYAATGSKKGNIAGILAGVIGVILFTYLYLTTGTQYFAMTAGLEFLAFLAFVYSASAEVRIYRQQDVSTEPNNTLLWPNATRF